MKMAEASPSSGQEEPTSIKVAEASSSPGQEDPTSIKMVEASPTKGQEEHTSLNVAEASHSPGQDRSTGSLQGCMKIGKVVFNVTFGESSLSWVKSGEKSEKAVTIPIEEILSVSKITGRKGDGFEVIGFTIGCVRHLKKNKMKREMVQFLCTSEEGELWTEKIQKALSQVKKRPRRLLIIVNPISGNKNGNKMYNNTVAGIFKQAGIETDVIVTEKAHHCEEIVSSYDLSSVDGIVIVGGDGTYHEAVNGLQRRLIKEAGLDENNPSTSLPVIPVPIGLIAAGTGNGIAMACYMTFDIETAALAIVVGKRMHSNILGAYCEGELVGYGSLLSGYGIWADLMYAADSQRSLKKLRYPVGLFKALFLKRHRIMDLSFEYLPPVAVDQEQQPVTEPAIVNMDKDQPISKCVTAEISKDQPIAEPVTDQMIVDQTDKEPLIDKSSNDCPMKVPVPDESGNAQPITEPVTHTAVAVELITDVERDKSRNATPITETSVDNSIKAQPQSESATDKSNLSYPVIQTAVDKSFSSQSQWKTAQGTYAGVMVFIGDYWSEKEKTLHGSCTRLILNKPCGGLQLLAYLFKIMTQNQNALENTHLDHMQVQEVRIRVNNPSEPDSENGKLEKLINLDGEIFPLKQPECHIRFHPKTVQLFAAPSDSYLWRHHKIE